LNIHSSTEQKISIKQHAIDLASRIRNEITTESNIENSRIKHRIEKENRGKTERKKEGENKKC